MLQLLRSKYQPIGLDLGHDSVKMLQLEVCGQDVCVSALGRRMLDPSNRTSPDLISPQAIEAIAELMSDSGFHGRDVVAALPRQIVHIKNLRLPQMPLGELANVVQFEARNIFPFDGEEAQVEFLPAGEVRQGADVRQEVIVLAARRKDVDRFVEQLHKAKVVINSLDLETCALYRSVDRFIRRREDEQEVHVIIDLGMQRSQVVIGKGRELSFYKPIETGGAKFNESVSKKLGITVEEARALRRRLHASEEPGGRRDPVRQAVFDATRSTMEELAKEISLCLRYYLVTFRGSRPGHVRLVGGEANDPQLLAILNSVLSIPVQAARPLFSVKCRGIPGIDASAPSAEWAMALGLGLKRTEGRYAPLDGTPRSKSAAQPSTAEVVDLNAATAPPKETSADHFAAVRRASSHDASATDAAGKEPIHA